MVGSILIVQKNEWTDEWNYYYMYLINIRQMYKIYI